jgi:hypothetical protein
MMDSNGQNQIILRIANTNQRHTPLGDLIECGMKGVKVLQLFTAKKHFHYRERIVIK